MVSALLGIIWVTACGAAESPLPTPQVVVERMLNRSVQVANAEHSEVWVYDRTSVMEELDDDGRGVETTEKLHRVKVFRGVPFSRLVKVRGQPLSEAELRKEDKREADFQKRVSGRDPNGVARRKEPMIKKDLMDRYRFEVKKRVSLAGRPTLQLAFAVKPERQAEKEKNIQDRILNRLAGTVWVDEDSAEVARLEVRLTKGFSLGVLGILGSLTECRFSLSRQPMEDGAWLPLLQETHVTARKLSSSIHFQVKEQSSGFRLERSSAP